MNKNKKELWHFSLLKWRKMAIYVQKFVFHFAANSLIFTCRKHYCPNQRKGIEIAPLPPPHNTKQSNSNRHRTTHNKATDNSTRPTANIQAIDFCHKKTSQHTLIQRNSTAATNTKKQPIPPPHNTKQSNRQCKALDGEYSSI